MAKQADTKHQAGGGSETNGNGGAAVVPQAGAVPFRRKSDGSIQVMLITNRAGGWIVPKGRIDPGKSPQEMAEIEAMEEAGVIGSTIGPELGFYMYEKLGRTWRVRLFALEVRRVLEDWPEKSERKREWVSVDEAINRVAFPDLRDVIERFENLVESGVC